jgi:hypothetical protein
MVRDGWFLPKLGSAVTIVYLQAVRARRFWCPRYVDVRLRPCLVPPTTKQLLAWIEEALRIQQANHPGRSVVSGFGGNKLPDAQWALAALSTLEPNHRIFGKGYVPDPPPLAAVNLAASAVPMVDNEDGLFDNLPLRKGKPSKRTFLKQAKPSMAARLERLQARRARLDAQLASLVQPPGNREQFRDA